MTDTSAPAEDGVDDHEGERPQVGGLAGLLGSGDHKTIGRTWIGASLVFGLVAFALAAVGALGQIPDGSFPPADTRFRLATTSRIAMALLFVVPLFIGLATYVVPLQVGARTIAFPKAAGAALWTWMLGTLVLLGTTAAGGGFRAADPELVDLSLLALGLVLVALLLATVCIVTTIVALRTPGMSLDRVPVFSWSMLVAGTVWLLQFGVALANLALVYVDHHYSAGIALIGRPETQFSQLAWVFSQPAVFALAIPALGIASDVVATASGARQPQRGFLLVGIGAFGAFSFGAWAQSAFIRDLESTAMFIVASVAVGLPLFLVLGAWLALLVKGRPSFGAPLVAALLGMLLLLLAALDAVLYVIGPLGLADESTVVVINNLVIGVWGQPAWQLGLFVVVVAASAIGGVAGIAHWGPKITGHRLPAGPCLLGALVLAGGAVVSAGAYAVIAFSESLDSGTLEALSYAGAVGAGAMAIGVLLVAFALLAARSGPDAGDDPWGTGQTLEWATASPPPPGNFGELAVVTSAEPLLDASDTDGAG